MPPSYTTSAPRIHQPRIHKPRIDEPVSELQLHADIAQAIQHGEGERAATPWCASWTGHDRDEVRVGATA